MTFAFRWLRSVVGLGGQFFVVMFSMLFIFQLTNIIFVKSAMAQKQFTQYNIAYKYFNVLNMAANIILTPFWSAFTDAILREIIIGCVVR